MLPAADAAAGGARADRSARWRSELLGGGLLLAIFAIAAATYSRSLGTAPSFDEAGYAAALDAIRHGQEIGSQVYIVQPPGFYFLIDSIGRTIGSSLHDVRVGMLLVSLVGIGAAYAIGRRYGGIAGGLGAASLLAIAPPFPVNAPRLEADPPSVTLGLVAIALAVWSYGPRKERRWLAAAAGVALACSILVKLFTGTVFVALIALAIRNRTSWRTLTATIAGGLGVLALLVLTHLGTVDDFWRGSVSGQLANRDLVAPSHWDNFTRVYGFFDLRTPAAYLALAGIVIAIVQGVRGRGLGLWPLWAWTASAVAFTVWMRPLLDHHLVLLAAAIAVPSGTVLGAAIAGLRTRSTRLLALAAAVLVATAGMAQQWRQLERNVKPDSPDVLWAADVLRTSTEPGAYVITDLPYAAVLADRRIAGPAVDTSWGRVLSGKLSADDVIQIADDYDVDVVVTGRMLLRSPGLAAKLGARFPERRTLPGGAAVAYLR